MESQYNSYYDAAGISVGKFCETIIRFLQHQLTGNNVPFGEHIKNFIDSANKLMNVDKSKGNESERILIPRSLVLLFTIRNKRGIGHIGGDIEANQIDLVTAVRIADWIICELIRIYHKLPIEEAQALIDNLSQRNIPDIWEIMGKKRVLRTDLTYKQETLLFSYSEHKSGVMVEDLHSWTKYKGNIYRFKERVLKPLDDKKLIEWDRDTEFVFLSPTGAQEVEKNIISKPFQTMTKKKSK